MSSLSLRTKQQTFIIMKADSYNRLLGNNVSAKYQKTEEQLVNNINKEAKIITRKLDLQDKVKCYSRLPAFITLKDHKPNFISNPKCRLLNPAKTQIGKISKVELDKINSTIRSCTKVNQWQSTTSVINWFQKLPLKSKSRFLKFDIVDFYPSITEDLEKSITFAKTHTDINDDTIKIIFNARKALLFSDNKVWVKQPGNSFDVTMGSFDGAEVCELVGLFLLDQLAEILGKENVGGQLLAVWQ